MKKVIRTRSLILFVALTGCSLLSFAQQEESSIKAAGVEMMRAFVKKDFAKFMEYMHPKIIEMAGGKERLLQRLDTANRLATQFGAEITNITIGHPYKVVKYKNEWQATLPQTTDMKVLNRTISLETTLIAISQDKGQHWYFIDTNIYGVKEIKQQLPDLSPDLVIPPQKPPVIKENGDGNNG